MAGFPFETERLRAEVGSPSRLCQQLRKEPITDSVIPQNLTKFLNFIKLRYVFEYLELHFDPLHCFGRFLKHSFFPATSLSSKVLIKVLGW